MLQYDRIWLNMPSHFHSSQWSSVLHGGRLAVNATRPAVAWLGLEFCGAKNHQRLRILRLDVTGAGSGFRRNMASDSAQGVSVCLFFVFEDEAGSTHCPNFIYLRILPEGLQLKKQTNSTWNMSNLKYYILVCWHIFLAYMVVLLWKVWLCVQASDVPTVGPTYLWYLVFDPGLDQCTQFQLRRHAAPGT